MIRKKSNNTKMTERSAQGSTRPRRGHQNHPKNMGIRSSNVPTSEIIQALRDGRNLETLFHQTTTTLSATTTKDSQHEDNNHKMTTETICDESSSSSNELIKATKRNSSSSSLNSTPSEKSEKMKKKHKNSELTTNNNKKKKKKSSMGDTMQRMTTRSAADGAENVIDDDDEETAELAKLRCTSERMEVQQERENRRQKKCADYPGLAFARSIFSSDSMMKFNIIRNELQNIMNNQLRRVRDYIKFV